MPKCGYHPRMGVGLKEIGLGLAEAVAIKSNLHSRTISEQLCFEKEEFLVVRQVVRDKIVQVLNPDEKARLEAFDAMLCLGEYFLNLRNSPESIDLPSELDGRVDAFVVFLKSFDDVWKHQLLNKSILKRAQHALSCCLKEMDGLAA